MKRIAEEIETTELCSYGCGCVAKYKNGSGKLMCLTRSNSCPAIKTKNSHGVKNCGRDYVSDYKNLPQESKDRMAWNKGKLNNASFEYGKSGNHKGHLIQERGHSCESCGLSEWLNKPITLELEHIDGDNQNNVKENLKLLCPNCHSFTDTWKGRNISKKKLIVSDSDFVAALNSTKSIRQALLKLGLTPKGANYERAYNLINGGMVERQTQLV